MDEIFSLISSYGFPIVACVVLAWYSKDTTAKIIALTEKVTDALVNSTRAVDDIREVIEKLNK